MKKQNKLKNHVQGKLALMFSLVWRADPAYIFILTGYALCSAAQVLTNVILPKYLIDELTGAQRPERLVLWGTLLVAANAAWYLLAKLSKRLLDVHREAACKGMERLLAEKVMRVEYRCLEDPACLDLRERARFALLNQNTAANLVNALAQMVRQAVTLAGLVTVMLQLSWVLLAIMLGTVGVLLLIQGLFSGYQQRFFAELLPVNRKYGYYVNLTFEDKGQKDYRLYGMDRMLGQRIAQYNRTICDWFEKYYHRQALFMGTSQMLTVVQTALAYGYVGVRCVKDFGAGRIGIGSLTMYVSAAVNFSTSIFEFGHAIINIQQMLGYLQPFAELMQLPEEETTAGDLPLQEEIQSIRFEKVTFSYPKTDKKVLDEVSFEIKQGEKISIVGLNGAGKSTIVKLICRLYRPDSGRILLNGRDIFEYDYPSFLSGVAAVFQDYKLLDFSIEENVTCRDAGEDEAGARLRLNQVGLGEKLAALPLGMKTRLGKAYDENGTELSGGQSQKIAIARALYKQASLVILDEPTSALDPMAEAEIYENFRSLVGGKTAVFISHRMSSSVFCDRVLVLENGRVAAFAPHEQLMLDSSSLYFKMFTSQAVNYQL